MLLRACTDGYPHSTRLAKEVLEQEKLDNADRGFPEEEESAILGYIV